MAVPLPRLKRRVDFLRVARAGHSWRESGLVLQAAPRPAENDRTAGQPRVGFTASRRVGGAVARNRAKRRLRALADQILAAQGRPDKDYVLIARTGTLTRSYDALRSDLMRALAKVDGRRDGPAPGP